jgi:hypothetical protein
MQPMNLRAYLPFLVLPLLAACAATRPTCRVAHDVFFVLEDASTENCAALVAACERLRVIPGVVRVTAGVRDQTQARDVNRQDFHVGLHVEFESAAAYDAYLPHPVHQELLDAFREGFQAVEVFDYLTGG